MEKETSVIEINISIIGIEMLIMEMESNGI